MGELKADGTRRVRNRTDEERRRRNREAIASGKAEGKKHINHARNWLKHKPDGTFAKGRINKYRNKGRMEDGIFFPSGAEADRYLQLKEMQADGQIDQLEVHPRYACMVNGQHVCDYVSDFRYRINPRKLGQRTLVEDVKGVATDLFKVKMKLMKALHPSVDVIQLQVGKRGSLARYRWLTADQFHAARDPTEISQ
jgi:Protein of unknown function (DUF1064)